MAIANGLSLRPIKQILKKNNCTWFLTKISKLDARKKWIISSISPKGELIIDLIFPEFKESLLIKFSFILQQTIFVFDLYIYLSKLYPINYLADYKK